MVELPSGGRKRVFDRNLNMFVSVVVRRRVIDYDIFVRRDCKQNMDMKSAAVTVFVARCDYSYVASNDVVIVLFQPLHFAFDRSARRLRRIAPFKSHLQWDLHDNLSVTANSLTTIHECHSPWLKEACLVVA